MEYFTRNRAGRWQLIRLNAVFLAAGLLIACGGGGGGSDGSQSSSPDIRKEAVTVSTEEDKTEVRQLEGVIDPATLSHVAGFDSPDIATSFTDDTLTITVGDLENPEEERFTVVTDTNIRYTVVITANNTSAEAVTRQAASLAGVASPRLLVEDDLRLLNTVLEIEYLARDISETEKSEVKAQVSDAISSSSGRLTQEISLLDQALSDYREGAITETDLKQRLAAANDALGELGRAGAESVKRVADTLVEMGVSLPVNLEIDSPLVYVAQADRYSRFMGSDYGSFDGSGGFAFNPPFDFFNAVFPYAD